MKEDYIIVCFDPEEIRKGFGPYIDSTEYETLESALGQIRKSEHPELYKVYKLISEG